LTDSGHMKKERHALRARGVSRITVLGAALASLGALGVRGSAPGPPPAAAVQLPDTVSFANDVLPIFRQRCAECHGAERQGTADGGALTTLDMTADEFLIFLRTGGELGNEHLFGTTKISNPGIESLFAYLAATVN